jgi:signal transduction histidine kinase
MAARFANRARIDPVMLHDLRSPMNALALELELLKESLPAEVAEQGELPERVRSIEKSFKRFKHAWEGFARHCANRDESPATFPIADLFADAAAPLESLARRRRVALEVRAPDRSALVAGRRDLLAQALLSIAIHRLEAVPPGGQLSLGAQVERERLQILLSDTGTHALPADVSCFWDPRLSAANDDAGLSLYVARSILLAHRGSLDVEATADGTRVTIELAVIPPIAFPVA